MSFPWLMVKVRRHKSISIQYQDEQGCTQEMNHIDQATSELLQHEIDHLDGVLAVDLALDQNSLVSF
jgi:peptide deformylase